ncbi:peptide deformylase [Amycolatopsis japonica]|uniref:peptide deformylase n=1 Tax=Amycolatopsis japonica TaxID=208439 RepID=UPI0037892F00
MSSASTHSGRRSYSTRSTRQQRLSPPRTGGDTDEQYEGCLSFFDVRGQVPRPRVIHVEQTTIDGQTKITVFERGVARLAAHEIDHLHGTLYTDHMRAGVNPIPVEQYRGTGTTWKY